MTSDYSKPKYNDLNMLIIKLTLAYDLIVSPLWSCLHDGLMNLPKYSC